MTTLVTGATGFVGRALALSLAREAGAELVRAMARPAADPARIAELQGAGVQVRGADLTDASLDEALVGVEVVFHCAWVGAGAARDEAERVNLVGTEALLAAAKRRGVRRVVMRSSECVTRGWDPRTYVDESWPQPPQWYDIAQETLSLAEDLVVAAHGPALETVALRHGVLWGHGDARAVASMKRALGDGRLPWIDGGRALVATTHVESMVSAMRLAATAPEAGGLACYLTDDERVTWREFATRWSQAVGARPPTGGLPFGVAYAGAWVAERLGARGRRLAALTTGRSAHFNIQRARRALGYAPSLTVDEGMRALAQWWSAREKATGA